MAELTSGRMRDIRKLRRLLDKVCVIDYSLCEAENLLPLDVRHSSKVRRCNVKKLSISLWFLVAVLFSLTTSSYAALIDVSVNDFFFQGPGGTNITKITMGDTVRWTNQTAHTSHTSTSGTPNCIPDGKWDSNTLSPGQSFSFTFNQLGTYPFFCNFHCLSKNMIGTIVVNLSNPLPAPSGQQIFPYLPIASPVISSDPSLAEPVSVGPVSQGGNTLTVQLTIGQFTSAVDIYGAFMQSTNPQTIVNVKPDLSFQTFSILDIAQALATGTPPAGSVPLMANVTTSVNVTLFSDLPISTLSPGIYTIFLLVTLPGDLSHYFLWETAFEVHT
jgi:plastocyanin